MTRFQNTPFFWKMLFWYLQRKVISAFVYIFQKTFFQQIAKFNDN